MARMSQVIAAVVSHKIQVFKVRLNQYLIVLKYNINNRIKSHN
jgi:hypothetical protein